MSSLTAVAPAPAGPDWYQRIASGAHPEWCSRGHRCGAGEHRAQPVKVERPGTGSVVFTRVSAGPRREHAEVRMSITLAPGDFNARAHLLLIVGALEALLEAVDISGTL